MDQIPTRISHTLWIGVGLLIVIICLAFVVTRVEPKNPGQRLVLPVIGPVADFAMTNQQGSRVTLADFRGHVWLADIIFSRCSGPCPRMTRQMKEIQDTLPATSQTRLVTLTTDPDYDTPPILKAYAGRFGADPSRWTFLTGTKQEIAALATGSLKLSAIPVKPAERTDTNDLFVHSTIFVVVDKQARLRGVFETSGEGVEWTNARPAILAAVRRLEREP